VKALEICERFSSDIFYNKDTSNIVVRLEKQDVEELCEELRLINYLHKNKVRESKQYFIINFEKIFPFELTSR